MTLESCDTAFKVNGQRHAGFPLFWMSTRSARPHGLELLAGRSLCTAGLTSPLDSTCKPGFSLATSWSAH